MMKQALLLSSAMLFALAGPADAKPDHAKHGKGQAPIGYGVGGCPPGLAKKNPQCMPPGRYRKLFEIGQRVPAGYRGLMGYNALPSDLRRRYGGSLDPRGRYIYDQGYLYRVDPRTLIVSEILRAVL
jgi:hypothetical protein